MNAEQKILARSIRKKLVASVPATILERLSDEDLLHQWQQKMVADLRKLNDTKLRS